MDNVAWLVPGLADGQRPRDPIHQRGEPVVLPSGYQPGCYGRPQDRAPVSNRGLVVPVDGRRMISTGVGITLIAVGAIFRFAVPATFTYGLNAHVVSVIVILAGIFGLLLSLRSGGRWTVAVTTTAVSAVGPPRPAMGDLPGPASVRFVEAVTVSCCCGKVSTGRRTASDDGTSPLGSDQSRPSFHPAAR